MAAPAQQAKVLRIGIIQDGKIVQERLIKAGETVTVGESAKNTFVFPKTSLPQADFPLFVFEKSKGYVLSFTEEMKGKISAGGAVVGLDKLRADPAVSRHGANWQMTLTDKDRGKVTIDNVTILFQFVAPPPVQAVRPIQAMDFRPRLLEEDDPIFLGFLAIFTALAAVLVIYVANTEPREIKMDQIPERFTKMLIPKEETPPPEDLPDEPKEDPNQAAAAAAKAKAEAKTEAKAKVAPKNTVEGAKQAEALKQNVMQNSLMLKMLVTRGEGSGTAENLWSDDDAGMGDIDAALASGVNGVAMASADSKGLRTGSGTSTEDVDIGDLNGVQGGTAAVAAGPKIQVTGNVDMGEGDMPEEVGDAAGVKKIVRSNSGQLKYCYEQRLKVKPTLEGRVEMEWTVSAAAVTSVVVVFNGTGDEELATCIKRKIRRWRFPDDVEGTFTWPWVFKPST
ncbi:MAG: AgmX/PglI C-terminal domain-containing protein [Deltaproteobacteria bacterium]|nr:AgmX/PglI C-terminal domain-containing protein [Deltaproteobacteria bacterium]